MSDSEDPVDSNRPFLRPVDWAQPWGEDGDVLDYVAASTQNAAERNPRDGCWAGRWSSYEEIRLRPCLTLREQCVAAHVADPSL